MVMLKDLISKYFVLYEVPLTDKSTYTTPHFLGVPHVLCVRVHESFF